MKIRIAAIAITMSVLGAGAANATLIGTNVTGSVQFAGNSTNYFDPANGFVPSGPENKTGGTTVPVSLANVEFGFQDSINHDTADFGGSVLTIMDISSGAGNLATTYTFTDVGFNTASIITNNFAGLTLALMGSTLTVNIPGFDTIGTQKAQIRVQTETVPEPFTLSLFGAGLVAAGALRRRNKKSKEA